jgi:phosphoadenosine phosphosulfate reductase
MQSSYEVSVNAATRAAVASGINVLNAYLFGQTETEHVARLLDMMDPPPGAVVIDAGCGVGAVAEVMAQFRSDLQFVLVNSNAEQLARCPARMQQHLCSFDQMPLDDCSADVVMFHFSICHAENWSAAAREAWRVLKPGGLLFINDMQRMRGDNTLLAHTLKAYAHPAGAVEEAAQRCGFELDALIEPAPVVERLAQALDSPAWATALLSDVAPAVWRFTKAVAAGPVASAFARHRRIGFQFSGGRDSTAALYLLRPYWDRMTVYHLDTGDQFPETRAVVEAVERDMGKPMTRIAGDVEAVREQYGLATDLLPVDNTALGRMVSGKSVKLISRFDCCYLSLMKPMQARMVADGITLVVRGQRDDEYHQPPLRSGDGEGGIEALYPIQDWTGDEVSAYLVARGLPLAPFYERGARRAPECMGCTAWWDEGRAAYLRKWHPVAFTQYQQRMGVVKNQIHQQYAVLMAAEKETQP